MLWQHVHEKSFLKQLPGFPVKVQYLITRKYYGGAYFKEQGIANRFYDYFQADSIDVATG